MPLQSVKLLRRRLCDKLLFELFGRQTKSNIHVRATIAVGMTSIEVAGVNRIVQQPRLLFVLPLHCRNSAFLLQPFADQGKDVNPPGVWSVVKGFVLDVSAIVEHHWKSFGYSL